MPRHKEQDGGIEVQHFFLKRRFIEINKTIYIVAERERQKEYS